VNSALRRLQAFRGQRDALGLFTAAVQRQKEFRQRLSADGHLRPSAAGSHGGGHPGAGANARRLTQAQASSEVETAVRVSRPRTAVRVRLVEAVGIEPTSGNPRRQASTSIAGFLLLSPLDPPTGWIFEQPAPHDLAPHPGAGIGASQRNMTPLTGPR
jgi:hypothetical protein